jgi:peptidoglycan hydrolase-like protein with peptidoglycan-binding domain
MAKTKKNDLPTVDEQIETAEAAESAAAETATATEEINLRPVPTAHRQITVPLADIPVSYLQRRIDLRKLTGRQSLAVRQLQEALDARGVRLANGSRISNPANALKWLLEEIAD